MAAQRVLLIFDAPCAGAALRASDALLPGARQDQILKIRLARTEDEPVLDGGAADHSMFIHALLG